MLSLTMCRTGSILCGLLPRTAVLFTKLIVASIHYPISCLVIEIFTYSMSKMDTDLSDPFLAIPFLSSGFLFTTRLTNKVQVSELVRETFLSIQRSQTKMRHTSLSSGIPALYSQETLYPSLTTYKTTRSAFIIKL